ncbi:hypothetical protein [Streptomyces sp. NEAU-174]|uniref:hypothetical protein n=1 Tax=Streptomyces sp. NEAU-174 TaxID=3458254 RepID=UPI004043B793
MNDRSTDPTTHATATPGQSEDVRKCIQQIADRAALLWTNPARLYFRLAAGQECQITAPAARRDHPAHSGTRVTLRTLLEGLLDRHLGADELTSLDGGWYELDLTASQPPLGGGAG